MAIHKAACLIEGLPVCLQQMKVTMKACLNVKF